MTIQTELPPLAQKPSPPPGRRRFGLRFSLLSLLVVAAVACVGAAFYGVRLREQAALQKLRAAMLQLNEQQAEIAKLRAELGYLTIADKTKVHALLLPARDDYHWKWRIYLPPERRWQIYHSAAKIPAEGFEKLPYSMSSLSGGEFTLEVFVDRDTEGRPRFVCSTPGVANRMGIPDDEFARLKTGGSSWRSLGHGRMELRDPGQPIEVLRFRKHEEIAGTTSSRTSDDPQFGFLVWIEEARPTK